MSKQDLRAAAEAALANTPVWCGKPDGVWTPHRAGINFQFIQQASPEVLIDLLDELARTKAALDEALRGWKSHSPRRLGDRFSLPLIGIGREVA